LEKKIVSSANGDGKTESLLVETEIISINFSLLKKSTHNTEKALLDLKIVKGKHDESTSVHRHGQ
jgi:hypothetical protein